MNVGGGDVNVGGSRCECEEQPIRMWGLADVNVGGSRCE